MTILVSAVRAALPLAAAVLGLPACALVGGDSTTLTSAVHLGPGGRAEARVGVPAGGATEIDLRNAGPGRADHVIRWRDGETLSQGAAGTAHLRVGAADPRALVVVLEAHEDAGTRVDFVVRSSAGVSVAWDLSKAFRTEP